MTRCLPLLEKGNLRLVLIIRYTTTKDHIANFIKFKFDTDDLEFRELNFQFAKDFEFYLKTVRNCSNNTTLKYCT
ncbi:phage integrase SAM-like domain-containing protein [Flavobacterium cerinum]|uniref:phage integrase SAM-like domain-containing protein n=1 Tax=Flavobacterium cerinum TaxID=2502784 RepID=UPI001F4F66DA|nr:phage integrase SAM-like domain-containing protein [Flavobacterium cerinum]